jgi:hypothetical protein
VERDESIMASFNIIGKDDGFLRQLRTAISNGLSTNELKSRVEKLVKSEIEDVVEKNQDLFRPDRGPDGGDDLVALLGIGEGGRPLVEKYAGKNAAWSLLKPGTAASKLTSNFVKSKRSKFGVINYEINTENFYKNFRSTYISRKGGDSDFEISWMQYLIEGIPTEQIREYPDDVTGYVMVRDGENFNPNFSRTGLGHMVPANKIKIPAKQFVFNGRTEQGTFGILFDKIDKKLSSSSFKNKIEKAIANLV